jgi:hypothetical protein
VTDDATVWFDQFPDAPGWEHPQWCARHWAPCPTLGANGMGAATELIQVFIEEIAGNDRSPDALNAQMDAAGRLCCTLGDARMYELWGHWPPAQQEAP